MASTDRFSSLSLDLFDNKMYSPSHIGISQPSFFSCSSYATHDVVANLSLEPGVRVVSIPQFVVSVRVASRAVMSMAESLSVGRDNLVLKV